MKVFKVIEKQSGQLIGGNAKLTAEAAQSQLDYTVDLLTGNGMLSKSAEAAKYRIVEAEADRIGDQFIVINGDDIGYQFNSGSNGTRTAIRTVRNLHINAAGQFAGTVRAFGLHLTVIKANQYSWQANGRA